MGDLEDHCSDVEETGSTISEVRTTTFYFSFEWGSACGFYIGVG